VPEPAPRLFLGRLRGLTLGQRPVLPQQILIRAVALPGRARNLDELVTGRRSILTAGVREHDVAERRLA